ncbi:DUF6069 family protein [Luteipulveratus halotolerans]|uniref:Uncharacterized protein n=1 Tax=Luteipulveratus halotolerans TaxID=1631356 RepID=A0A0L6CH30_9MICO|nr:DUF6069 family protein [Luteipulveratus halotolerans]KNX36823.1 hypothetical protein VV01_06135 [Luteipulveratus halotolerans]
MDIVRTTTAVVGAAAAALAGWGIARMADVALTVEQGGSVREVGPWAVVVSTLVVGAAATLTQLVLTRRRAGLRWWLILAGGVLVLSLGGPLAATTTSATFVLIGLHLVVGAVLMFFLRVRPTADLAPR